MTPLGSQAPDGGRYHCTGPANRTWVLDHDPSNTTAGAEQQFWPLVSDVDPTSLPFQGPYREFSDLQLEPEDRISSPERESSLTDLWINYPDVGTADPKTPYQMQSICHICGTGVLRKNDFTRHLILHIDEFIPKTSENLHIWDIIPSDRLPARPEGRIYSCGCCWRILKNRKEWLPHVESECGVFELMSSGKGTFQWRWGFAKPGYRSRSHCHVY